jgi:hypothetical protein
MTKSKQNITLDHNQFTSELRSILQKHNLKINSATISVKDDNDNKVVMTFSKNYYIFSKGRAWHEY